MLSPRHEHPTLQCWSFRVAHDHAIALLNAWLKWARRCQLQRFVRLGCTITEQRAGIEAALEQGLSNARVEQVNTPLRLIVGRLVGIPFLPSRDRLAMLALAGLGPSLSGR